MGKSSPRGARSRQIAEINDLSASGRRVPMGGARMGRSSPERSQKPSDSRNQRSERIWPQGPERGARIRKSSPQGTRGRQMMEITDLSVFYGGRYRKWSNRRRVATSDGRIAGKNACKLMTNPISQSVSQSVSQSDVQLRRVATSHGRTADKKYMLPPSQL